MSILVLTSDTLIGTPATGNLEYNGQFFGTDSNASRAQLQRIASGTAVASTSGTSIDFTGLPAWVKKITVSFSGVSTNGGSDYLIQLGDAGGIETTSYIGSSSRIVTVVISANYTTGFGINNGTQAANYICSGVMTISLLNSATNLWAESGVFADSSSANTTLTGGSKALSDVLTQVRITTVGGTNTFDAGSVNILYEG